jgi:hypothetical protein
VKLRKQAPAKAAIVAVTAALLAAFYSLVRSEPRIAADKESRPPIDYERFFAPASRPAEPAAPSAPLLPRTRAS